MDTFKKKLEVLLTLAILIGVGLYVTGAFEAEAETAEERARFKAEINEQLAKAETSEERFKIIEKTGDVDLMREMADKEARQMLKSGDVSAFEDALYNNVEMSRMLGDADSYR